MKAGWKEKSIGEILQLNYGKPLDEVDRKLNGLYPVYGANGVKHRTNRFYFDKPSIIVGRKGSAGEVNLTEPKFWPLDVTYFVTFDERQHNLRFLYYLLTTLELPSLAKGVKPGINRNEVYSQVAKVPPLPDQKLIVGILDEAFDGIATAKANAEKNLQNARAIFESHLQSVLLSKKWKWKTLGDLCDGVEYGSSAKSKKEGKVPVLRMGNIQDGRLDWENLVYTDDKAEIKKYLLKHNDVLFNRTNSPELVGKTAIYKSEMPAIFAGYLIRICRKEELLDADYLSYFLNSQIAFDYGKTVVISSVNQANINGAKLKGYPIPAPSITEQKIIVKKLDSLRAETQRLARLYERKLAALEALKKSLLHQAFSGKL